jgi:hypothetical protein
MLAHMYLIPGALGVFLYKLFQNLWIGQVARKNKQIKLIKT